MQFAQQIRRGDDVLVEASVPRGVPRCAVLPAEAHPGGHRRRHSAT